MRRKRLAPVCALACALAGCHGTVPAVGLSDTGEDLAFTLEKHEFRKQLEQASISVNESTLPALTAASGGSGGWTLDMVRVGLSIRGGIGIGVARVDGSIGFQVLFKHQR